MSLRINNKELDSKEENCITEWPKTSDKEFSKRMFIIFMWGFFAHIAVTIIAETFFCSAGAAKQVFEISVPVYTTIFAAVIVKGGVENVFKGKSACPAVTKPANNKDSVG